jgi:hypothetical protein
MSFSMFFFLGFVVVLLILLVVALGKPAKPGAPGTIPTGLRETGKRHVSFLPAIQQALGRTDLEFLLQRGPSELVRRVRRERRRIALAYLSALRQDFEGLLRMASIIAKLSPKLAAIQEFERFRLTLEFAWRYSVIRLQLRAGLAPIPQLEELSELLSALSIRMETAVREMGEQAALAAKLASSLDGHDVNGAL